ncbi:amino acid ABC transporter ATP-binding protein [Brachyspira pilosicoli]|uniref:amino acid ABC transporter ATP-binding protein n=1 Tax=Brachyspira pilosicoli TaxID=52584 RepID=UPI00300494AF
MDFLIRVENLKKSFKNLNVLNNISFNVSRGEALAIIGASGCGKSTLLRCIIGLEQFQGKIYVHNEEIDPNKENKLKIGMVFQQFNLFPHYTVGENIYKPCITVLKTPKQEAIDKAKTLLKKVRLEDKFNQYPNMLSGGQKQRVAIARVLAMDPEIILFDEPTSSLDPDLSKEVFSTINELKKDNLTIILVTHQINALKSFASRIIFLHNGDISVDGSTDYVLNECKKEDLRIFLDKVNF